ncbi:MAG: DUF1127 domain-containing protein [Pseudomonadota bacterium]
MASITNIPAGRSVTAALTSLGASITDGLVAIGRARARSNEIEALMDLSDEELSARGITREGIVRYVHRDSLAF